MRRRAPLVQVSYAMTKLTCGILVAFVMQLPVSLAQAARRAHAGWL